MPSVNIGGNIPLSQKPLFVAARNFLLCLPKVMVIEVLVFSDSIYKSLMVLRPKAWKMVSYCHDHSEFYQAKEKLELVCGVHNHHLVSHKVLLVFIFRLLASSSSPYEPPTPQNHSI